MQIKAIVTVPKGYAHKIRPKIEPYLIGSKKKLTSFETFIDDDASKIVWEVEGEVKKCFKIRKNLKRYNKVMKMLLKSKKVQKTVGFKSDEKKQKELNYVLANHTSCEIIMDSEANEKTKEGKTFWQSLKDKMKRQPTS